MVLSTRQTTAFFEDAHQMGIPNATMVQLRNEDISTVDDFDDFDKTALKQIAENLRCPAGRIPDPNSAAATGTMIPMPLYMFGAKFQECLLVACDMIWFYDKVGHVVTTRNLVWTMVMKNFEAQYKALKDKQNKEASTVPSISKYLTVMKWSESFQDYLHWVIGCRIIPLAYVIHYDAAVPAIGPQELTFHIQIYMN
eukprot:11834878-Ditylum_brightwellii.AAC.1